MNSENEMTGDPLSVEPLNSPASGTLLTTTPSGAFTNADYVNLAKESVRLEVLNDLKSVYEDRFDKIEGKNSIIGNRISIWATVILAVILGVSFVFFMRNEDFKYGITERIIRLETQLVDKPGKKP